MENFDLGAYTNQISTTSDNAQANAMRRVYFTYKDDHDVAAFFTEAIMTRTPWKLWDVKNGLPANDSDVLEKLEVTERLIAILGESIWDNRVGQHAAISAYYGVRRFLQRIAVHEGE